ncbi:carrier YMC1 mitochondrial [Zalerion maritima]|uniref:Carrier YMC1 mitochondrial n=1 Tax=Zalerion maritima TaxID=339359 RepID=A0AAD5S2C4_9PEZI|nr:carrier YMC1 mitochondrial [Zalerion maritima]
MAVLEAKPPPSASSETGTTGTKKNKKNYKGFVAGVFSGITKLSVGHPFDTIKVRLQTTTSDRFSGPLSCLLQTLRHEGFHGLYKGATPPLVGWVFMDSVMLGSLTVYRRLLSEHIFHPDHPYHVYTHTHHHPPSNPDDPSSSQPQAILIAPPSLPSYAHGIAGILAGSTVSLIAAPVEHVKARLQIQYSALKSERFYSGPVDCLKKVHKHRGIRGIYHGLSATLFFRSFFFFWWGSYDVFTRLLQNHTDFSAPAVNFWAGGLSAQVFWLTSYPSDVVKQRIMTDPLGGTLGDGTPKFRRWKDAARAVYREGGWKGYWRGFVPCFLRAFPANAMALVAFEGVMRALP